MPVPHIHEAREDDKDWCARCGQNFRHEIHLRSTGYPDPQFCTACSVAFPDAEDNFGIIHGLCKECSYDERERRKMAAVTLAELVSELLDHAYTSSAHRSLDDTDELLKRAAETIQDLSRRTYRTPSRA